MRERERRDVKAERMKEEGENDGESLVERSSSGQ